jgi:hypothetical protein
VPSNLMPYAILTHPAQYWTRKGLRSPQRQRHNKGSIEMINQRPKAIVSRPCIPPIHHLSDNDLSPGLTASSHPYTYWRIHTATGNVHTISIIHQPSSTTLESHRHFAAAGRGKTASGGYQGYQPSVGLDKDSTIIRPPTAIHCQVRPPVSVHMLLHSPPRSLKTRCDESA